MNLRLRYISIIHSQTFEVPFYAALPKSHTKRSLTCMKDYGYRYDWPDRSELYDAFVRFVRYWKLDLGSQLICDGRVLFYIGEGQ